MRARPRQARPLLLLLALFGAVAAFAGSAGQAALRGRLCPVTLPATDVTSTTATLNGSLSGCFGKGVPYFFEYGATTAYGTNTPDRAAPNGTPLVSEPIAGLTPGTTYHYRIVAFGEVAGGDVTFTTTAETAPPPPPPPPTEEPPPPPPPPPGPPPKEGKDPDNPSADLSVEVTVTEGPRPRRQAVRLPAAAGGAQAAIGQTLTYTAVVFNHGPREATAVSFTDTLPSQVGFQSVSTSQGSCSGGQTVSCSLGRLGDGASATVRIVGVATASGTATNTASVSNPDQPDANPGNNSSSSASTQIAPPAPPAPIFGQTFNVQPVSGTVLIRLPGTDQFVPLTEVQSIPEGAELDATNGVVEVISASDAANDLQSSKFAVGRFVLSYEPTAITPRHSSQTPSLVTNLTLSEPLDCPAVKAKKPKKGKKGKKGGKGKRTLDQAPKKKVRSLWGNGSGNFRTRGRFTAATVRGTEWLTQDTCAGTLVRVREGVVEVFDFTLRKTVTLNAGESYFARAPKR